MGNPLLPITLAVNIAHAWCLHQSLLIVLVQDMIATGVSED